MSLPAAPTYFVREQCADLPNGSRIIPIVLTLWHTGECPQPPLCVTQQVPPSAWMTDYQNRPVALHSSSWAHRAPVSSSLPRTHMCALGARSRWWRLVPDGWTHKVNVGREQTRCTVKRPESERVGACGFTRALGPPLSANGEVSGAEAALRRWPAPRPRGWGQWLCSAPHVWRPCCRLFYVV